jgi:hypothetical protein
VQNDIPNLVSANVCGNQLRSGEIRTRFSAAGIAAVAEGTILLEKRPPCRNRFG